ncbi:MAG: acyltransferase family protein [Flavobacteriales bacterium]
MSENDSKQLLWLDLLRGIAAFLVLIGHLRSITFVDFSLIQNPSVFVKFFYFITDLGHEAVMIFFVLSGFFIIKSIVESTQSGNWSWKKYATSTFKIMGCINTRTFPRNVLGQPGAPLFLNRTSMLDKLKLLNFGLSQQANLALMFLSVIFFFKQYLFLPMDRMEHYGVFPMSFGIMYYSRCSMCSLQSYTPLL